MIDNINTFETPEGIHLNLNLAGPVPRALAWLVDMIVQTIAMSLFAFGASFLSALGFDGISDGLLAILVFLWVNFYFIIAEATKGKTIGKHVMGLSVVNDDGTPLSWSTSMIRNFIRPVEFFPMMFSGALFTMLVNSQFKRLGDIAAGTLVVYKHKLSEFDNIPQAKPAPLPRPLTLEEQRAILEFAERCSTLSESRQLELASSLKYLELNSGGASTAPSVERLIQYANWIKMGGVE